MSEQTTAASKPKSHRVGEVLTVSEGATIVYPDGYSTVTVAGSVFVLDRPGTFVVDGTEVTAK